MVTQKPPKSDGKITGFPYSFLWEEFGSIWQSLSDRSGAVGNYEALLAELKTKGADGSNYPSRSAITELVKQYQPAADKGDALIESLYRIWDRTR